MIGVFYGVAVDVIASFYWAVAINDSPERGYGLPRELAKTVIG